MIRACDLQEFGKPNSNIRFVYSQIQIIRDFKEKKKEAHFSKLPKSQTAHKTTPFFNLLQITRFPSNPPSLAALLGLSTFLLVAMEKMPLYLAQVWEQYYSSGIIISDSTTMGKKTKNEQKEEEAPEAVALPQKTKPLQKYLPHDRYQLKRTKLQLKRKEEAISFIKIDKAQVNKAVTSLKEFIHKTRNVKDLFQGGSEGFIYIEIDMAEVPEHYSVRPIQIQLPVPIYSEKYNSRFAVFTSDPESDFTAKIQDLNLPLMSEAIGYDRAKKHYRDNREKLKLLNANDLFFCDWKIYNLLRKHLGKLFYEKKRYPFPIDCEGVPEAQKDKFENYEQYLNSLANSTYTMLGNGPVYALKVGRLDMSNADLVKNIMRATYRFLPHILEEVGVEKVRQISIKGFNSPSLPIYNYLSPEEVSLYQKHSELLAKSKVEAKAK